MFRILSSFSRLSIGVPNASSALHTNSCRFISTSSLLNIHISPYVLAQPLRKKTRLDPMIEKSRIDRKKRKLEKRIRQLEKQARLVKPVEELMPNFELKEQSELRSRGRIEITPDEQDRRILLLKSWTREQLAKAREDEVQLAMAVESQEKALQELKKVSPRLYKEAIKPYDGLLPYTGKGPNVTPPAPNYDTPDGNYVDKSKKWIINAEGNLI